MSPCIVVRRLFISVVAAALVSSPAYGQGVERDIWLHNFRFATGESLDSLRMHVVTLGRPRREGSVVRNAVLILHGTTGTGRAFLGRDFAGKLYGRGQPFDTTRYYVILPDGIGHGKSSKPSDGLRARFPRYDYDDMVRAEERLLTEGLGVTHLRLVVGTSMGCMHAWVWGTTRPTFADGLVPLACAPTAIVGRNRMWRTLAVDAVTSDPAWKGGNYTTPPPGLLQAMRPFSLVLGSPLSLQVAYPTREAADRYALQSIKTRAASLDANDFIYALGASRTYDPSASLERVTAPVLAINFSDDLVNPPELGLMEKLMPRVKHGKYVLWPITRATRGHGTHSLPAVWGDTLAAWMKTLP